MDSYCTSAFGCPGNTRGRLCGDPSLPESFIEACLAGASAGMCVETGDPDTPFRYSLPSACQIAMSTP